MEVCRLIFGCQEGLPCSEASQLLSLWVLLFLSVGFDLIWALF